jgi:predicted ABC-type ATPase
LTNAPSGRAEKDHYHCGPNGAGKTTFAAEFLQREANVIDFINADLIAKGLSPFAPERAAIQAGKIMLNMIGEKAGRGESFAFETTLSGKSYARHIPEWRKMGYRVELLFLTLPSAELAVARVKSRVRQGGHDVPDSVIIRRFDAGIKNFRSIYSAIVDGWELYDNAKDRPILLESGRNA